MAKKQKTAEKRGRGRPTSIPGVYRNIGVRVCYSAAEIEEMKAKAGDVPLSAWIRWHTVGR